MWLLRVFALRSRDKLRIFKCGARQLKCSISESEMSEESMDGDQYGRLRASQISSMKPKIVNHLMGMLEEKLRSSGVDPVSVCLHKYKQHT